MHVYLIHATGTNRFKIGITARTIESRLNELNGSQSAFPLELITSIRHANYKAIEKHLHDRYAANRRHGEWFEFSSEQLAEVKNYMHQFDTQIENIKPILRNRPPISIPSFHLPLKNWMLPLLIGLGLIYTIRQVEFFHPSQLPTIQHSQQNR